MLKREILLTGCAIVLALSGHEALAAEACTTVPTCAELGYTKTDCGGYLSLKCPFDKTKLFCGKDALAVGDIVKSDGTAIGVVIGSNLAMSLKDDNMPSTWSSADNTCNNKTTGGKSWRLPTGNELAAVNSVFTTVYEAIQNNGGSFPLSNASYWTSTAAGSTYLSVTPQTGGVGVTSSVSDKLNVRCVFDF